jgi:hypothetical protein
MLWNCTLTPFLSKSEYTVHSVEVEHNRNTVWLDSLLSTVETTEHYAKGLIRCLAPLPPLDQLSFVISLG